MSSAIGNFPAQSAVEEMRSDEKVENRSSEDT
jgi:hypothetical protein